MCGCVGVCLSVSESANERLGELVSKRVNEWVSKRSKTCLCVRMYYVYVSKSLCADASVPM